MIYRLILINECIKIANTTVWIAGVVEMRLYVNVKGLSSHTRRKRTRGRQRVMLVQSSVTIMKQNANCDFHMDVYTHFSFSLASGSKNLTATSRLPRVVVVPYSGIPSASATYTFIYIICLNCVMYMHRSYS